MHRSSKIPKRKLPDDDAHRADQPFQIEAEASSALDCLHQYDGLLD